MFTAEAQRAQRKMNVILGRDVRAEDFLLLELMCKRHNEILRSLRSFRMTFLCVLGVSAVKWFFPLFVYCGKMVIV